MATIFIGDSIMADSLAGNAATEARDPGGPSPMQEASGTVRHGTGTGADKAKTRALGLGTTSSPSLGP